MPSAFLYSVPRDVLIQLLQSESRKQGYTDAGARVSLLLDLDAGKPRSRGEYATLWGWTPKVARLRWAAILADVLDWATSGGRQTATPLARRARAYADEQARRSDEMRAVRARAREGHEEGHGEGTQIGPEGPENDVQGHGAGHGEGTRGARHTNQPSNPTTSSLREDTPEGRARARGPDGPEDTAEPRPTSRDACRAFFAEQGRSDLADAFLDHFTSNGWRVSGRTPMRDWRAAARNWIRNDDRYGRSRQPSSAGPAGPRHAVAGRPGAPSNDPGADYDRIRGAARAAVAAR